MTAQQTFLLNSAHNENILFATADEIVSVLESQLEGFRKLYEITLQIKEMFSQSGETVLSQGIQERTAYLQRIQKYEERLKELKLQWNAYSDLSAAEQDARIHSLVEECQSYITQISELDRTLHQTASERKNKIQNELAHLHQKRQPLAAYLTTPPPTSIAHSVPISGQNVHFSEA